MYHIQPSPQETPLNINLKIEVFKDMILYTNLLIITNCNSYNIRSNSMEQTILRKSYFKTSRDKQTVLVVQLKLICILNVKLFLVTY